MLGAHLDGDLLLDLLIVGSGFFSGISSILGSSSQLFLDQGHPLFQLPQLLFLLLLDAGYSHHVVGLGLLLDRLEHLLLSLLSAGVLLNDGLLDAFLLRFLLRVASLANEKHSVVVLAGTLLNFT